MMRCASHLGDNEKFSLAKQALILMYKRGSVEVAGGVPERLAELQAWQELVALDGEDAKRVPYALYLELMMSSCPLLPAQD